MAVYYIVAFSPEEKDDHIATFLRKKFIIKDNGFALGAPFVVHVASLYVEANEPLLDFHSLKIS